LVNGRADGVPDGGGSAEERAELIRHRHPRMSVRSQGQAVGASVVRIPPSVVALVAKQPVKHTHLKIQSVANRSAQRDVSLANGEVGIVRQRNAVGYRTIARQRLHGVNETARGTSSKSVSIRPEPQLDL